MSMDAPETFTEGDLVACPRCHGEGEIEYDVSHGDYTEAVCTYCPQCDGDGCVVYEEYDASEPATAWRGPLLLKAHVYCHHCAGAGGLGDPRDPAGSGAIECETCHGHGHIHIANYTSHAPPTRWP